MHQCSQLQRMDQGERHHSYSCTAVRYWLIIRGVVCSCAAAQLYILTHILLYMACGMQPLVATCSMHMQASTCHMPHAHATQCHMYQDHADAHASRQLATRPLGARARILCDSCDQSTGKHRHAA